MFIWGFVYLVIWRWVLRLGSSVIRSGGTGSNFADGLPKEFWILHSSAGVSVSVAYLRLLLKGTVVEGGLPHLKSDHFYRKLEDPNWKPRAAKRKHIGKHIDDDEWQAVDDERLPKRERKGPLAIADEAHAWEDGPASDASVAGDSGGSASCGEDRKSSSHKSSSRSSSSRKQE
jgi:hypothetical protein